MGESMRAHVLAEGTPGAPLAVLAHGLEDTWTCWAPMAAELDPSWRLVALDLPWRAGNDYRWRARPAGWWLADALDLVGAAPDVLISHSYGANATLELLCSEPAAPPRAAALLCPLYRQPGRPANWRVFDRARRTFLRQVREGVLVKLGARAETMEPGLVENIVMLAVDRVGPSGFIAAFSQFTSSADLPLGRVATPTLVLGGGANPTLARSAAVALADRLPAGRLSFHDEYDHFCHIRYARDVAAQVTSLVHAASATLSDGEPR